MEDQVWQGSDLNVDAFDFTPNMEASYRVKIEGRLLDDEAEADEDSNEADKAADGDKMDEDNAPTQKPKAGASNSQRYRFSHFFKEMTVDFDRARFRNGAEQSVEWKKPEPATRGQAGANLPPAADFDELTFKRNADENINITIKLLRHESPERYLLSPELAEVVDMTEATQQEAVMGLWEYVRLMGLQEDEEKRNFRCDDLLKKVGFL